jgi:hypothetical protein
VAFPQFRGASAKPWLLFVRNASSRASRIRAHARNVIVFSEDLKGKDRDRVDAMTGSFRRTNPSLQAKAHFIVESEAPWEVAVNASRFQA